MPEPLHPPYGVIQPRQLVRWLDVNAQNGPLGRNRGFITVPLDGIAPVNLPAQIITVTNNSADFANFKLLDIDGNLIQTVPIVSGGGTGVFDTLNNGYYIMFPAQNILILPYNGWTGNVTFNADHTWSIQTIITPSDKVLQFNYTATQNFSLVNDTSLAAFINTLQGIVSVCIVNVVAVPNKLNKVLRYRLTQPEIENVDAVQYVGQPILKGFFQIEFWNIPSYSGTINTSRAYQLNTSVLGNVDYRYGVDFRLHVNPATIVTNFQNNNPNIVDTFNLPLTFNLNNINGTN